MRRFTGRFIELFSSNHPAPRQPITINLAESSPEYEALCGRLSESELPSVKPSEDHASGEKSSKESGVSKFSQSGEPISARAPSQPQSLISVDALPNSQDSSNSPSNAGVPIDVGHRLSKLDDTAIQSLKEILRQWTGNKVAAKQRKAIIKIIDGFTRGVNQNREMRLSMLRLLLEAELADRRYRTFLTNKTSQEIDTMAFMGVDH